MKDNCAIAVEGNGGSNQPVRPRLGVASANDSKLTVWPTVKMRPTSHGGFLVIPETLWKFHFTDGLSFSSEQDCEIMAQKIFKQYHHSFVDEVKRAQWLTNVGLEGDDERIVLRCIIGCWGTLLLGYMQGKSEIEVLSGSSDGRQYLQAQYALYGGHDDMSSVAFNLGSAGLALSSLFGYVRHYNYNPLEFEMAKNNFLRVCTSRFRPDGTIADKKVMLEACAHGFVKNMFPRSLQL